MLRKKISISRMPVTGLHFIVAVEDKAVGQIWYNGSSYTAWYKVAKDSKPQSFSRESFKEVKQQTIKRLAALI